MSNRTKNAAPGAPLRPSVSLAGASSRSLKSAEPVAGGNDRWRVPAVCLFLAAITFVVFGQTRHFEFLNFDDNVYVYENPAVMHGLSLKGVGWAFTHIVESNWHPLTMLSHMLDCQWHGLKAGEHHLTNVLLHTASVILLFLVLRRMTGFLWRSAFVAAVFAIHPLHVESVAWVAERKDVLSGLFFMLTLWAYVRYVCHRFSLIRYLLVIFLFALGLLCKPMLVTLPFVLLLLDYWPLGRISGFGVRNSELKNAPRPSNQNPQFSTLLLEKAPLFGLAAASCVVTIFAQKYAIQSFEKFPLPVRVGNALVSYAAYVGQMFWPSSLAVLYPFTARGGGGSGVVLSLVLLAGISTGVFIPRRRCPYLLTGWLWYLIMLAPVIGILQVGWQARADRYTYLPQIGLYVLLTWAAADWSARWRHRRWVLGGSATVILAALICCARAQTGYWRNSELLWTHALVSTSDNFVAHYNIGDVLLQKGRVDEAIAHYQQALQLKPDYADAWYNLGNALFQKGKVDEAIARFQKALQLKPNDAKTLNNLGNALLQKGQADEAMVCLQKALQINPAGAEAQNNLGNALLQKGRADEAMVHFQKALQIKPDNAEAQNNLGNALLQKGRADEAIAQYQLALQLKPDYAEAQNNIGYAFLKQGKLDEAIAQFHKALQIKPDYVAARYNLGDTLFQHGREDEAVVQYQQVLQISPGDAKVHINLGNALLKSGRVDEAIDQYQQALRMRPGNVEAQNNLGIALLQKGRFAEAKDHFQQALQLNANALNVLNNLAWLLATSPEGRLRDGAQAVQYAERACELTHRGAAPLLVTLAAAYAEAGRYDEAVTAAEKACGLAVAAGEKDLLERTQSQLALYRTRQPYHEAVKLEFRNRSAVSPGP